MGKRWSELRYFTKDEENFVFDYTTSTLATTTSHDATSIEFNKRLKLTTLSPKVKLSTTLQRQVVFSGCHCAVILLR